MQYAIVLQIIFKVAFSNNHLKNTLQESVPSRGISDSPPRVMTLGKVKPTADHHLPSARSNSPTSIPKSTLRL